MSLLDDFLVRAALAGVGVALAAGPLGCFVVWRRMAYFGDATAHAALLGVALALLLSVPILAGVLVVALGLAATLTALSARLYPVDTLLGVFAHGGLALGLVAVALMPAAQVDLMALLLGDILAVGRQDLLTIWCGAALVLLLLTSRWSRLLISTLSGDLAQASGVDARREQLLLTFALAIVVAVALKVVGAILISALMIVPAATVRPFVTSPAAMAVAAAGAAALAALAGLGVSMALDTPTGPTIVAAATALFAVSALGGAVRKPGR